MVSVLVSNVDPRYTVYAVAFVTEFHVSVVADKVQDALSPVIGPSCGLLLVLIVSCADS